MCGICIHFDCGSKFGTEDALSERHALLDEMLSTLVHRGPDGSGIWVDRESGVSLGHRRLSVLDLSDSGRQPMISANGRFVLSFNGEIYNFRELKSECSRYPLRGSSDTEVLLAMVQEHGVREALSRTRGMFALGVWDRSEKVLYLARDRFGEKPLYYGWLEGHFIATSELAVLTRAKAWGASIDTNAVRYLVRHGYIPAPLSIFSGIYKLPQGCMLELSEHALGKRPLNFSPLPDRESQSTGPQFFWIPRDRFIESQKHPFPGSKAEALSALEACITASVERQMVADVPVGAFLSGGVDSSLIVALMAKISPGAVKTFSIGFDDTALNEAPFAATVATVCKTEHYELYVSSSELLDTIPRLSKIFSEPFADASQLPTYLVSRLARQHVTVALSGDGGDELFGGYERYPWGAKVHTLHPLLRCINQCGGSQVLSGLSRALSRFPRCARRIEGSLRRLERLDAFSRRLTRWHLYDALVRADSPLTDPCKGTSLPNDWVSAWRDTHWIEHTPLLRRFMFFDQISYLPDDILVKVDRAAMANSLETRVPLLDHEVVEFAWSLPLSLLISGGNRKVLLKELLYRHVPQELVDRPKQGFGVPLARWLRSELKEWSESLLTPDALEASQCFNLSQVRRLWDEHCSGTYDRSVVLWHILQYQDWRLNGLGRGLSSIAHEERSSA